MTKKFIGRVELNNGFVVEFIETSKGEILRLNYKAKMSTDIYQDGTVDFGVRNPENIEELKIVKSYIEQLFDLHNRFYYWVDYVRQNGLSAEQVAEKARLAFEKQS